MHQVICLAAGKRQGSIPEHLQRFCHTAQPVGAVAYIARHAVGHAAPVPAHGIAGIVLFQQRFHIPVTGRQQRAIFI